MLIVKKKFFFGKFTDMWSSRAGNNTHRQLLKIFGHVFFIYKMMHLLFILLNCDYMKSSQSLLLSIFSHAQLKKVSLVTLC